MLHLLKITKLVLFNVWDAGSASDDHLEEALLRAAAYANSGADGFFAHGLTDENMHGLCISQDLL